MIRSIIREFLYRLRGEFTTEKLIRMGMTVGTNFERLCGTILDPSHCWLITIGDNVTIAPRVHVLAHDASTKKWLGYTRIGKVTIGNNVFIGAESIILPNVTIGDNCIIGAGSVVTKDVEPGTVCAGNPARALGKIDVFIEKNKTSMITRPVYDVSYTLRGDVTGDKKNEMNTDLADGIGFVD